MGVMGVVKTGVTSQRSSLTWGSLCGKRMAEYRLDLGQKGCARQQPSDEPDGQR